MMNKGCEGGIDDDVWIQFRVRRGSKSDAFAIFFEVRISAVRFL